MIPVNNHQVSAEQLRWTCDTTTLPFECTDQLRPLQDFIGQERAINAIQFGLEVGKPGYNLFVTGLTGTGKLSVIKAHLQRVIQHRLEHGADFPIYDWCYIHNFSAPDRPQAIKLPKSKGLKLCQEVEHILKDTLNKSGA